MSVLISSFDNMEGIYGLRLGAGMDKSPGSIFNTWRKKNNNALKADAARSRYFQAVGQIGEVFSHFIVGYFFGFFR